ncbi:MAG: hypothetical protein EYC62_04355 [Alphaproteobacteria bacterium]|nr:MAG: hypothetical protein EYC62_04355 [Alphaproteobacteria bacterium]
MADIRVPPEVQPIRSVINPIAAHIVNATEAVQKMAIGQIISGQVIGKNSAGQIEVKTDLGVLKIQTTQALIPGKAIQIAIQQNGPQPQVQIQTVAQQTAVLTEGAKHADVSDQIRSLIAQLAPPDIDVAEHPSMIMPGLIAKAIFMRLKSDFWTPGSDTSDGIVIGGKVIQAANGKIQVQTQFGALEVESQQPYKPGDSVQLQLPREGNKQPIIVPQGQSPSPPAATTRAYATPSNPAMVYAQAADKIPRPQNVSITFVGPEHMEDGIIPIPAKVIHVSNNYIATLRIPTGILTLQSPFQLNVNDDVLISLNLNDPLVAAEAAIKASTTPSALPLGGKTLPNLDELIDLWRTQTNTPLSQFIKTVLPNTDGRFVNQAIMYFVAMTAGDAKFWLGPKLLKELEKDKADITSKLSDEFRSIQKSADETSAAPWRHLPLPVFDGQQLHYVQCYFRNHHDEGEESQGQRFVIEANLSRLGALQLDGFIREQTFNLMVRTVDAWPNSVQQNVRQIFQDYMDMSGWNGQISFQTTPVFPMKPGAENLAATGHLGTKI